MLSRPLSESFLTEFPDFPDSRESLELLRCLSRRFLGFSTVLRLDLSAAFKNSSFSALGAFSDFLPSETLSGHERYLHLAALVLEASGACRPPCTADKLLKLPLRRRSLHALQKALLRHPCCYGNWVAELVGLERPKASIVEARKAWGAAPAAGGP